MKKTLIRLLGGVPIEEHRNLQECYSGLEKYNDIMESFFKDIAIFSGYPFWKIQQEYRETVYELGMPLATPEEQQHTRAERFDQNLTKLVDRFGQLRTELINHDLKWRFHWEFGDDVWWEKGLDNARGSDYLKLTADGKTRYDLLKTEAAQVQNDIDSMTEADYSVVALGNTEIHWTKSDPDSFVRFKPLGGAMGDYQDSPFKGAQFDGWDSGDVARYINDWRQEEGTATQP